MVGPMPLASVEFRLSGPWSRRILGFSRRTAGVGVARRGYGAMGGGHGAYRAGRVRAGGPNLSWRWTHRALYDLLPVRQWRAAHPEESQLEPVGLLQQPV